MAVDDGYQASSSGSSEYIAQSRRRPSRGFQCAARRTPSSVKPAFSATRRDGTFSGRRTAARARRPSRTRAARRARARGVSGRPRARPRGSSSRSRRRRARRSTAARSSRAGGRSRRRRPRTCPRPPSRDVLLCVRDGVRLRDLVEPDAHLGVPVEAVDECRHVRSAHGRSSTTPSVEASPDARRIDPAYDRSGVAETSRRDDDDGHQRAVSISRNTVSADRPGVCGIPTTCVLYEHAIVPRRRPHRRGRAARRRHRRHTGRSPKDKFVVREPSSEERIWWGGNTSSTRRASMRLREKLVSFLDQQELVYVSTPSRAPIRLIGSRCASSRPAVPRAVREDALHRAGRRRARGLPARRARPARARGRERPDGGQRAQRHVHRAAPEADGAPDRRTFYAGEIKKSIFTVLNDSLPLEGVLPMHCSANVSRDGRNVGVFFGLSGTGKTTLSADPSRLLIGDDEHGWGDSGIFNFEGGCYAKTIRLSPSAEPEIWSAAHSYGTILENVAIDENGAIDLDDATKTENTRAAYKLEAIANALTAKMAGHPHTVIFLAADAFGILPPIALLTRAQALYYFLSGFTAKLAGTEIGVTEPEPTFSTCFGAPFLRRRPRSTPGARAEARRARRRRVARQHRLDGRPLRRGRADADRGDTGAARGRARGRAHLPFRVPARPTFRLRRPARRSRRRLELLDPRSTWRDRDAYDRKALELARMFRSNFATSSPTPTRRSRRQAPGRTAA